VYVATPTEEFAEYLTHYMLNATALKKAAPEMYEYLKKNVFDGLEYQPLEDCPGGLFRS
jgi:hypothetical protein